MLTPTFRWLSLHCYTFHTPELGCDEVEAIVQVTFLRHLLQVGVAVLILVHKVV